MPSTHPQINDYYDDDYKNTDFELYETGHNLMKMKGSLPSLRNSKLFEINEKLEAELIYWNLNPKDFEGKAHLVRESLQSQKKRIGKDKGFNHYEKIPSAWLTDAFHFNIFPGTSITYTSTVSYTHLTLPTKRIV